MHTRFVLLVAIALGFAATAAVFAADTDEGFSLYYKVPKNQPLVYQSYMSEVVLGWDAKNQPQKHTFVIEQKISNRYKQVGEETLSITATFSDLQVKVNTNAVKYQSPAKEAQRLIDVKGYRKSIAKSAGDFDKLDVILPMSKIKVGDSWAYTAPPTVDTPVYLVTRYSLTKLDRVHGREVAVIEMATEGAAVEKARRINISIRAKGQILFATKEGILVGSDMELRMITEPLDNPKAKTIKTITSSMKLAADN